jgi:GntR family transcriptional regulator/MocR family aminotransferase
MNLFIQLDEKNSAGPLYRQIYEAIRRAILSGELQTTRALPPTRALANQLGVARTTVINAYEQLLAEGYLEGRAGAGTFVAAQLPEEFLQTSRFERRDGQANSPPRKIRLSAYGDNLMRRQSAILRKHSPTVLLPFQHGVASLDLFSFEVWAKIARIIFDASDGCVVYNHLRVESR